MRAAAAARPVIATDVRDLGVIVRANRLGIVVTAASADALGVGLVSYLGQQERLMRDVAPHALIYARQNSWEVLGAAVRATYLECLTSQETTLGLTRPLR